MVVFEIRFEKIEPCILNENEHVSSSCRFRCFEKSNVMKFYAQKNKTESWKLILRKFELDSVFSQRLLIPWRKVFLLWKQHNEHSCEVIFSFQQMRVISSKCFGYYIGLVASIELALFQYDVMIISNISWTFEERKRGICEYAHDKKILDSWKSVSNFADRKKRCVKFDTWKGGIWN